MSEIKRTVLIVLLFNLILNTANALALGDCSSFLSPFIVGDHRGDTDRFQENSEAAILASLNAGRNIEVDLTNFKTEMGEEVGLLVHDDTTKNISPDADKKRFQDYPSLASLPLNRANPKLPPAHIISVERLFEIIKKFISENPDKPKPIVSLDLKSPEDGYEFGKWVGTMIKTYGFQDHVFASSQFPLNIIGVRESCPECKVGGLVYTDHRLFAKIDRRNSTLDIPNFWKDKPIPFSISWNTIRTLLGIPKIVPFDHDFILIHDRLFFEDPSIVDFWRNERGVSFVGIFTQEYSDKYTDEQVALIREYEIEWLELNPERSRQIQQPSEAE